MAAGSPRPQAVCGEGGAMVKQECLPHGWDAGVMFKEKNKTLLCPDLFHQNSNLVALTDKDILGASESGPFMDFTPYKHKTRALLYGLATLHPSMLATRHGSSFAGNCVLALINLDNVMQEVWGGR